MLKKIMAFSENTLNRYNQDVLSGMEDWKKYVLTLHERSRFLFYYEDSELEDMDAGSLIVQGELARDDSCPDRIYLYDGQGRLLGKATLMSDPHEKEEKRRGLLRFRKNQCRIRIDSLYRKDFSTIPVKERMRLLSHFYPSVSLLSDAGPG